MDSVSRRNHQGEQLGAVLANDFVSEFNAAYGSVNEVSAEQWERQLTEVTIGEVSLSKPQMELYAAQLLNAAARLRSDEYEGAAEDEYLRSFAETVTVHLVKNGTPINQLTHQVRSLQRQTTDPQAAVLANHLMDVASYVRAQVNSQQQANAKLAQQEAIAFVGQAAAKAGRKAAGMAKTAAYEIPVVRVAAGTALAATAITLTVVPAAASELATSIPTGMQNGVRTSVTQELQPVSADDVISVPNVRFNQPESSNESVVGLVDIEVEPQAPISDNDSIELPPGVSVEPPMIELEPSPKGNGVIALPPGTEIVPPTPEPKPEPTPSPAPPPTPIPPKMPVIPPSPPVGLPNSGEQDSKEKNHEQIDAEIQKARDKAFLSEIESYVARAAQSSKFGSPIDAKKLYGLLIKYDDKNQHAVIDREFIMSALWQESTFKPRAVSSVGAKGLGQFMPGTAKEMGLDDPFDPEESVRAAYGYYIKIYKIMEDRFPDKSKADLMDMTLAGYNAGPYHKRLIKGKLPQNSQTQGYIRLINELIAHVEGVEDKAEKKVRAKYDDEPIEPPKANAGKNPREKKLNPTVVGWGEGVGGEHELTYFNQRSDEWANKPYRKNNSPESQGTIELCGCGPSALSMSIATMTGKKTNPVKMSEWFMDHGGPVSSSNCASNWIWESKADSFERDFGVKIKRISGTDAAIKKAIDKGGMVVMSQGSGMFTSGGHIMMVTGYVKSPNKDGGNHKYLVGDSNSTRKTTDLKGYSPSVMIGNGTPVPGVGLGGAGADRGYLKAAWSITPINSNIKSTSSEVSTINDTERDDGTVKSSQMDSNSEPTESRRDLLEVLAEEEERARGERALIDEALFGAAPEVSKERPDEGIDAKADESHDEAVGTPDIKATIDDHEGDAVQERAPRVLGEGELFKIRHDNHYPADIAAIDDKSSARAERQRDAKIKAEIDEIERSLEIEKEIERLQNELNHPSETKD